MTFGVSKTSQSIFLISKHGLGSNRDVASSNMGFRLVSTLVVPSVKVFGLCFSPTYELYELINTGIYLFN